jgi:hypothetical protein
MIRSLTSESIFLARSIENRFLKTPTERLNSSKSWPKAGVFRSSRSPSTGQTITPCPSISPTKWKTAVDALAPQGPRDALVKWMISCRSLITLESQDPGPHHIWKTTSTSCIDICRKPKATWSWVQFFDDTSCAQGKCNYKLNQRARGAMWMYLWSTSNIHSGLVSGSAD